MADLTIRHAEERDIDTVAALDKLCFTMPWSMESFVQEITDNDVALYLVAEIEGRIVGYAGLWIIADEGHITNVAVHPDFRRKSIGKALVQVLIDASAEEGVLRHTLEVRVSNQAAIGLYESFGFAAAGLRKGYYDDTNEDAIIMWRG